MGVPVKHPELNPPIRPALESAPSTSSSTAYEEADSLMQRFSIVMGGPISSVPLKIQSGPPVLWRISFAHATVQGDD